MPLLVTGISHHTAPLQIREKLAFGRAEYACEVAVLCANPGVEEAVLVSTCNRTEIYGLVRGGDEELFLHWLAEKSSLPAEEVEPHLYTLSDEEAVGHLFRVACGLDSLVLGEPQILGQLKEAWQEAREAGGAGKLLDRLFQRAFSASKQVRSQTGINDHPVSVAYITAVLARQIFGELSGKTVLLVGAGEMITLCSQHFIQKGVKNLLIANRSLRRAEDLAETCGAQAMPLDDLESRLAEADIVISSTSSMIPVIRSGAVEAAIKSRRRNPIFLVDLGVPRDIDPEASRLPDVYLYTIDDLRQVADENLSQRKRAATEAIATIEEAQADYMRWMHGARAAGSIKRLREHADRSSEELARRAVHQIKAGADPASVIDQLANTLTHKILHAPSTRLRQAAEAEQLEILRAADWLFESDFDDLPPGIDSEDDGDGA